MPNQTDGGEEASHRPNVIKATLNRRLLFAKRLDTLLNLSRIVNDPKGLKEFKVRCEPLSDFYTQFLHDVDELSMFYDRKEDLDDFTEKNLSLEASYFEVLGVLREIERMETQTQAASQPPLSAPIAAIPQVRLPKIEIPSFNGDRREYTHFIEVFEELVGKVDSLSDLQKFSYLKGALTGQALNIANALPFNGNSYTRALELFKERYGSKDQLVNCYLQDIFLFSPLKTESTSSLNIFLDKFHCAIQGLLSLSVDKLEELIIFSLAFRLLPHETRKAFEETTTDQTRTYNALVQFLYKRVNILSSVSDSSVLVPKYVPSRKSLVAKTSTSHSGLLPPTNQSPHMTYSDLSNPKRSVCLPPPVKATPMGTDSRVSTHECPLCPAGNAHSIYSCPQFQSASVESRFELLKLHKRCFNCLGSHFSRVCASKATCKVCKSPSHHSLLHRAREFSDRGGSSSLSTHNPGPVMSASKHLLTTESPSTSLAKDVHSLSCKSELSPSVLLGTIRALVQDHRGTWFSVVAVLDSGSEVNLVSEDVARALCLSRNPCQVDISGISSNHTRSVETSNLTLRAFTNPRISLSLNALVVNRIASDVPSNQLPRSLTDQFSTLQLANPHFGSPKKINILLGAGALAQIVLPDKPVIHGSLIALPTTFGHVVMGQSPPPSNSTALKVQTLLTAVTPHASLETSVQRFWEIENFPEKKVNNPDDQYCEDHYSRTVTRTSTGQYIVSLPFRQGSSKELGSNTNRASSMWYSLERKFSQDPSLKRAYSEVIHEYLALGQMRYAKHNSLYVIPHHPVFKPNSSTTACRPVFNASAVSSKGISLNSELLPGPALQKDIALILCTFRLHPIALTCDIKHMYRAIALNEADRSFQPIYWRDSVDEPLRQLEITCVAFGVTSSPFLALRTLQQLVSDDGNRFPKAAEVILSQSFVDDCVMTAPDVKEALDLHSQMEALLRAGGFQLHKWTTNHPKVLESIPESKQETKVSLGDHSTVGVLGLQWCPSDDSFTYEVHLDIPPFTKRGVLSVIARLYDIMGFLAPVILYAKTILQLLWKSGCDWDEELPKELAVTWGKFTSDLPKLNMVKIPRCILSDPSDSVQLVGFCDASSKGMAAVIYLRVFHASGLISSNLIRAKTRVAPLKTLTIPRLELCAAQLFAALVHNTTPALSKFNIYEVILFSDSANVLSWLRIPPHNLHTFVANRVVDILSVTPQSNWNHVPGALNPADVASRGLMPSELVDNAMRWHGPEILVNGPKELSFGAFPVIDPVPEMRDSPKYVLTYQTSDNLVASLVDKCSYLSHLQKIFAWIRRFHLNSRQPHSQRRFGRISLAELEQGLVTVVRVVQQLHFAADIAQLKSVKLPRPGLRSLSPYVDDLNLVRVGGRLKHSPLSENAKHPMLIPNDSRLALLICQYYHTATLHGGPKLVQSLVQRRFWIINFKKLMRRCLFRCDTCYRLAVSARPPIMADLPVSRFAQGRAFLTVSVDFTGHYQIKSGLRRNSPISKAYVALFICLSTRAIHLEPVTSLDAIGCLAAIDRFIGRRGLPSIIYSDNGTNLVGAHRRIREVDEMLRQTRPDLEHFLQSRSISWRFAPPAAPWFVASHERGIGAMKHHLKRVIHGQTLSFEQFATLLCKIEAILNSRPLCPLSTNPTDGFDYLTPGHFLIGGPLIERPELDLEEYPLNLLTRWRLVTRAAQSFWTRWHKEYLHTLIQRPKWQKRVPNLNPNDLVFVTSTGTHPLDWPVGRVNKCFPGEDGTVRVVEVVTPRGTFIRAVAKVIPLPPLDDSTTT